MSTSFRSDVSQTTGISTAGDVAKRLNKLTIREQPGGSYGEKITAEDKYEAGNYGKFQPAVDRIVAEAKSNFSKWDQTLKNWTVYAKTKEYTLHTSKDSLNDDLLTLKLVATAYRTKGDLFGAFQHMLTSGDMEKHDSYITDKNVFSTPDGAIKIEYKHLSNPYPFV